VGGADLDPARGDPNPEGEKQSRGVPFCHPPTRSGGWQMPPFCIRASTLFCQDWLIGCTRVAEERRHARSRYLVVCMGRYGEMPYLRPCRHAARGSGHRFDLSRSNPMACNMQSHVHKCTERRLHALRLPAQHGPNRQRLRRMECKPINQSAKETTTYTTSLQQQRSVSLRAQRGVSCCSLTA